MLAAPALYLSLVIAALAGGLLLAARRAVSHNPSSLALAQAPQNAGARLQLEHLYQLGLDALRNNQFAQAAVPLQLAARRGDARAQLHYGVLCEHGIGVPLDLARARDLYALAASQGDVDAHFRLQVLDTLATLGDKVTGRRRLKAISTPI